jgi:hypothetical protein
MRNDVDSQYLSVREAYVRKLNLEAAMKRLQKAADDLEALGGYKVNVEVIELNRRIKNAGTS